MKNTRTNKKRFRKKTRRNTKKMNGGNDDEMKLIYKKQGHRISPWGGSVVGEVYLNNQGHIKIIITQQETGPFGDSKAVFLDDKTYGPISNNLIDLYKNVMKNSEERASYDHNSIQQMGKELGSISLFKQFGLDINTKIDELNQTNDTLNTNIENLKNEINSLKS